MGFWIELHCDAPEAQRAPDCANERGTSPGVLAANGATGAALALVRTLARSGGWRGTRQSWFCPACTAAGLAAQGAS